MKNPNEYNGIIELSERVKKKVKLSEDEKILFCIGEVRWSSNRPYYGVDVVQMRTDDFFNPYCMKNTVITSKRIILPMTSFLGYNIDCVDIFYSESSLHESKKTFPKRYGFWISSYALGDNEVIFDLKGKKFDLQIVLFSSVVDRIAEVLSNMVGTAQESI